MGDLRNGSFKSLFHINPHTCENGNNNHHIKQIISLSLSAFISSPVCEEKTTNWCNTGAIFILSCAMIYLNYLSRNRSSKQKY